MLATSWAGCLLHFYLALGEKASDAPNPIKQETRTSHPTQLFGWFRSRQATPTSQAPGSILVEKRREWVGSTSFWSTCESQWSPGFLSHIGQIMSCLNQTVQTGGLEHTEGIHISCIPSYHRLATCTEPNIMLPNPGRRMTTWPLSTQSTQTPCFQTQAHA